MSESRRAAHPQEPVEGSKEDVEAPGIEEARDELGAPEEKTVERSSAHPQEPAEGGEAEVEAPGADRPGRRSA
ncbi:MAG: hypothetical protein H0U04_17795 [Rubrobacter sp.]|nr:hypothetical protein [Rubrobacter sp.]